MLYISTKYTKFQEKRFINDYLITNYWIWAQCFWPGPGPGLQILLATLNLYSALVINYDIYDISSRSHNQVTNKNISFNSNFKHFHRILPHSRLSPIVPFEFLWFVRDGVLVENGCTNSTIPNFCRSYDCISPPWICKSFNSG